MYTAKFLLTHSDKTDPEILTNDGQSFLAAKQALEKKKAWSSERIEGIHSREEVRYVLA
jgi:hypothetical protein